MRGDENKPVTRAELRQAILGVKRARRKSAKYAPKQRTPQILDEEVHPAPTDCVTRAELRETIDDKTAHFVKKEDFARLETTVKFIVKGLWLIFIAVIPATIAALWKIFGNN